MYLNGPVKGGTGKLVVVFGVDDNVHDVVSVSVEHLTTHPLSLPVPQFDQHVICERRRKIVFNVDICRYCS